jgi:hypothetical protein
MNSYTDGIKLTEDAWLLAQDSRIEIKRKIESLGKPLKKWNISINYGIKSGFNEAFIINTAARDLILSNCATQEELEETKSIIRPVLRGKDIGKYVCKWDNLWLINTHNGVKGRFNRINVDLYPAIKLHLDSFGNAISKRADKGETPYNLRNCTYVEFFRHPKIVWQAISKQANFAYDRDGTYFSDVTTFIMVGENLEYILSILNSKLFEYALIKIYLEGDTFKSKNSILQDFHIPIADESTIQMLNSLVDRIMQYPEKQDELQRQIDFIVYKLYRLTYDEVKIVDPQTSITKESYDVS